MRILLFLLLLFPVAVDFDGLPIPRFADALAADADKDDKKKDKQSEQRKRVEEETKAWVEKIEEDDRKRRGEND